MLTITNQIPDFTTYEEYLGYRGENTLFFDIETTGLSPAAAIVFLIGTVRKCDGRWQLTQWLAQRPEDEPELLRAFFDTAAGCDTLIHFNGTTFDLPFIRERAKRIFPALFKAPGSGSTEKSSFDLAAYSAGQVSGGRHSLDLYQKFRPLKNIFGLSRMNQAALETFLGWPREDRLSGKQMISLFQKYAASQEPKLGDLLLLHNHNDLLGMTELLCLSAYSMLFDGQFASVNASLIHGDIDFAQCTPTLRDAGAAQNTLALHLMLKAALPRDFKLSASDPCFTLSTSGVRALLSIPGFRGELRHFFPNYRDYYYLPLEDQAVHKSVGAFVDKEFRIPARPENCCVKKSGLFFPQPEEYFSPAFRSSCESKELFFACPESEPASHEMPESGRDLNPAGPLPFAEEKLSAYTASLLRILLRHV